MINGNTKDLVICITLSLASIVIFSSYSGDQDPLKVAESKNNYEKEKVIEAMTAEDSLRVRQETVEFVSVLTLDEMPQDHTYESARNEVLEVVKQFESFSSKVYLCPAGVPTIGYGFTGKYRAGRKYITKSESEKILIGIYDEHYEAIVEELGDTDLTFIQIGSLVSLSMNVGLYKFLHGSIMRELKSGNLKIQNRVLSINTATITTKGGKKVKTVLRGLTKRRNLEVEMYNMGFANQEG